MSAPSKPDATPLESKADLVAYLASGCRPREDWRIGTEHEKLVFVRDDLRRPTYDGPQGILALLTGLQRFGWSPIEEGPNLVALTRADGASVTFEPGGQLELSGAMLDDLHRTCSEIHDHLEQVRLVGTELGLGVVGLGFDPKWQREQVPWMPRSRHQIMRAYMPQRGTLGLDMMLRTCTVQVNLDFGSESDMVQKLRVSTALQPIVTALFANSPFTEGQPNGYQSYRAQVWSDTDNDRSGLLPFIFDSSMGFERYVDWALDVPMYFVQRNGEYHDVAGQSFRSFMAGELVGFRGQKPTMGDWVDHLSILFPDVRLKRFLEQRGADAGPWRELCALPALWVGLLYDQASLDAAWELVSGWSLAQHVQLRERVPVHGLRTQISDAAFADVGEVALRMLEISRAGLERRHRLDAQGRNEARFLDRLCEMAESRRSRADILLAEYRDEWNADIDRVYDFGAYA